MSHGTRRKAVMDVSSAGVVPLHNMPDVIGLVGRRDNATESRVLQGRDARSIRVLVPDCRGLDQNFHDVTIVDMGDLPECRQRELEQMRKAAKGKYRQKHPAPCTFCGALIKYDMYRHVAHCHLELAQLWRCPVSWCTIWRGTPQDLGTPQYLMDHIREAHTGEIRKVSLEKLFPPWTVTRLVYTESLTSRRSGISNDVLLFSEVGLSLVHHYRVHKRGLPNAAFRGKYLAQLRALLPLPTVLSTAGGSTDAAGSTLPCMADPPDVLCATPRPSRRVLCRWRPVRVMKLPGSRSRTRWLRRRPWCLIVVRH